MNNLIRKFAYKVRQNGDTVICVPYVLPTQMSTLPMFKDLVSFQGGFAWCYTAHVTDANFELSGGMGYAVKVIE